MSIFKYEIKKLLFSPALLIFIVLCLGFNIIISSSGWFYDYPDYIAEASKTTGYKLGAEFDEKLAGLEPDEFRALLAEETAGVTDIFDDYNSAYIAEAYINRLGLMGYAADAMRNKYAQFQKAVDKKAETDESLSLYFAGATTYMHKNLHSETMSVLLLECGLLSALIMLLSIGYEQHNRTSHIVYATKTGRKIMSYKLFASLTAGLTAFAVLTVLTLAVYFVFNDYGNVWGSSVSNVFHYILDIFAGKRPFITWQSYTAATYLLAALGITALLTVCFGLMAFVIGMWVKNSYVGFLLFVIVNAGCVVFSFVASGLPQFFAVLTPVWLWLKRGIWFTDGGADILWKSFETLGGFASLLMLAGLCAISAITFRKRDIA